MKSLKLLLFLLLLVSCNGGQPKNDTIFNGEVKFDVIEHKMGKIYRSYPKHRVVFKFQNVGTEPLLIYSVNPFCGCVTAQFTKEPVLPGKTGYITLTYNGASKSSGYVSENVEIMTSSKTTPRCYLNVSGELVDENN
ncbi:MAG: DUF1573 domain-containing protein [Prevotella sp.]|nr:DUF1573 domain-containing protein [Prevotella sp.]